MARRDHSFKQIATALAALVLLANGTAEVTTGQPASPGRRMSFHNRLLLNRAVLSGLQWIEVLLLVGRSGGSADAPAALAARVSTLGGRVHRSEPGIGYLRVEIPIARLLELVATPLVDAYQISSLSRGSWYRDGPPSSNATMFRGFEVTPTAASEPVVSRPDLPLLSVAESREPGFTADDAGVSEWLKAHPTFDGRGVTIALIESALPAFDSPSFRTAKTIDGRDVPKIAGILNALDPQARDETRVRLDSLVEARKTWTRVGERTYVFPRPGRYRLGLLKLPAGANVIHQFAVIEDELTREVWIDANGDASFHDESPLADVNQRFEPRALTLTHPRKASVSFVMGRGRQPDVVHIYIGKGSHQSMTLSVAAGSRTDESLAYGVAPNARVLLVRIISSEAVLAGTFEGFIEAAQRPDVDVIGTSLGLSPGPDTAADFAGAFFSRLADVYGKPVINGAGNTSQLMGSVHSMGKGLSVGGIHSPATYAALYGGRALDRMIVSSISAGGPSLDGAVKPDFLAPMERIAVSVPWETALDAVPRAAPSRRLPPGYEASCCTSATSPYATGVAALLISGAKQSHVRHTADRLNRAMTGSARLVPGFPAHLQGNGTLDVNGAWLALARDDHPPRISASARIVHPLAQYAARGPEGTGILEVEGWTPGMTGTRTIVLRRHSGPSEPLSYRLDWSADDGTFDTAPTVALPLNVDVPLDVRIAVTTAGAHSGLLTLRDRRTNAIVFRTQATIVAGEQFDTATGVLRVGGRTGLMRQQVHYVKVPAGISAIEFALDVTRGVVRPRIVAAHGLHSGYYGHVHPIDTTHMGKGRYRILLPNPDPGTWTFSVDNTSTWSHVPRDPMPSDDNDADYTLTLRLLHSSIATTATTSGGILADITNAGSAIAEPVLEASPAYLASHRGSFLPTGLPNVIDIDVPRNGATLSLRLRSQRDGVNAELRLYDCTTGECFSYNIGVPAARAHTLVVRKPNAGRWVAAVNAAPFPSASGTFVLDELVTIGTPVRRTSAAARGPGARWRETIENVVLPSPLQGKTPVVLLELLDASVERGATEHPWTRPPRTALRDRPVAIGTAVYRQR